MYLARLAYANYVLLQCRIIFPLWFRRVPTVEPWCSTEFQAARRKGNDSFLTSHTSTCLVKLSVLVKTFTNKQRSSHIFNIRQVPQYWIRFIKEFIKGLNPSSFKREKSFLKNLIVTPKSQICQMKPQEIIIMKPQLITNTRGKKKQIVHR